MSDRFAYPESLSDAPNKNHWYHSDCFGDNQNEFLHAFIHSNYEIGMHMHSFYEINIVLKGEGMHYIENSSLPVHAGNVFIIPPNIKHGYYKKNSLDVYHVLISDNFFYKYDFELKNFEGYFMLFEIEPYLRGRYSESMFLTLSDVMLENIMPFLNSLISCNSLEYSSKENIKNTGFLTLAGYLCYLMCQQNNIRSNTTHQRYANLLMSSVEYIHNHYDDKISLQQLADTACMSVSTYIRYFKKMYACPPIEYIIQYRIEKAKSFLLNNNLSLTEVAQNCGFYDASHFIKHFERTEKISPQAYKNKIHTFKAQKQEKYLPEMIFPE